MTAEIRERLPLNPFVPFTIYTADGREYVVPTTDHVHVWPNRLRVRVFTDAGREFVLPASLISGLDVEAESLNTP